jgi:hypothetical protein
MTARGERAGRPSASLTWVLVTAMIWTPALIAGIGVWKAEIGSDARAYWLTGHRADLYPLAPGQRGAYLYSPAFAQAIWPLTHLPFVAFRVLWLAGETAAFVWLLWPMGLRFGVPAFLLCQSEIVIGNIYALLAVVCVIGLRHGAAWSLPLLTKLTPAVGVVWFAVRREWRSLGVCTVTTVVIVAASVAVSPHDWTQWIRFLAHHRDPRGSNLWPVRVAAGLVLTVFAARTGRAWLLPFAMVLAQPMAAHWYVGLPMLAAVPRLRRAVADRTPAAERERLVAVGEPAPVTA